MEKLQQLQETDLLRPKTLYLQRFYVSDSKVFSAVLFGKLLGRPRPYDESP